MKKKYMFIMVCVVVILAGIGGIYCIRYNLLSPSTMQIGQIIDGVYYFIVPHKGLYCYEPEGNLQKILKTPQFSTLEIEKKGIYYAKGRDLYYLDIKTNQTKNLYSISKEENGEITSINFDEEELIISCYEPSNSKEIFVKIDLETGVGTKITNHEKNKEQEHVLDNINILTQMDDYIFYVSEYTSSPSTLYCYSKKEKRSWSKCGKVLGGRSEKRRKGRKDFPIEKAGFINMSPAKLCAEHGINLTGESPVTGIYRQV